MGLGDQIYVYRELLNVQGTYQHHGIDCGDGTVMHYRKPSEVIEQTSLSTFARGNRVYVREYPEGFCFIPEIVLQRAKSRLGENKYNLVFNNCEHFATWAKTGISDSKQIRDFMPLISRFNLDKLNEPLMNAFKGTDRHNAETILEQAIADIRVVWDQIQPQYKEALQERDSWHQVALEALRKNREDLAKGAIKRKLSYQTKAEALEKQLAELAKMTENLVKNSQNLSEG
ncbi:lecithin retinol acyltransferase family protein [Gloeocapsa sp. PCC 73106]|uniref:lecithin retinol acyltransferase family protein n=1 Tax=Gloeocapsa sp. PCC 73106 TaxID=102232 RepID=UPI0002AC7D29|nr:lecithin retinol acyltransferase family protein [Gloeocapsa sp. PCC 73106]ELR99213.1 phage shock protein A (IM30), suppresses sigma54-dependent transcription [Gloeocapsa sp. PCC 73106]